ncbi:hypothetical protein [Rhizobacter sp. Root1221]|nr:hypothetical protein [Rhizobacter sp. Root1221]
MIERTLGAGGLEGSAIGLGCMGLSFAYGGLRPRAPSLQGFGLESREKQ